MTDLDFGDGLDANRAARWERREQRFERIGWYALVAILLAGAAGLFGTGLLSGGTARDATGQLTVEFERFTRFAAPHALRVHVRLPPDGDDQLRLWIDLTYLRGLDLDSISPQPRQAQALTDRIVYVFDVADRASPVQIRLDFRTQGVGVITGRLGLEGGPEVRFKQFAYP